MSFSGPAKCIYYVKTDKETQRILEEYLDLIDEFDLVPLHGNELTKYIESKRNKENYKPPSWGKFELPKFPH